MAERPIVVSAQYVTGGDKDTVSSVIGNTPGSTTGSGAQACGPITLADAVPSVTTNKLYNASGQLYFNGGALGKTLLMTAGTFNTSSGGATNLLTCAFGTTTLNTLTALDSIEVKMSIYYTGGACGIWLRNSTDTIEAWGSSAGGDNLGDNLSATKQLTTTVTLRLADIVGGKRTASSGVVLAAGVVGAGVFTTAWTGAWTLALRFTGTAGNAYGSWAVYRVLGQ